ncbi:MAG: ClpXP protease specificity-enhancing factor [Betaproteobacteria bacterium]|nr:ClpXP protease specificity-enhancing factor [Betaproteobacteria bacterium]
MKTTKPYLIRAIHEWCADQGFTPYLAVKVDASTRVPREFVKDGEIVLNVGLEATHQLLLGNEEITFQARFGGRAFPVVVPIERVAAIYARENGEGMAFEVTERPEGGVVTDGETSDAIPDKTSSAVSPAPTSERTPGRPFLTRIK